MEERQEEVKATPYLWRRYNTLMCQDILLYYCGDPIPT